MARLRRTLDELIDEVQLMLNEEDSDFFTDAVVQMLLNQSKDEMEMLLMDQHEGFNIQVFNIDIVANQATYELPEDAARLKRVAYVETGGEHERTLHQDRKSNGHYFIGDTTGTDPTTYRLLDNFIEVYPIPDQSVTNGLKVEFEIPSERLVNDADKLPDSWPAYAETGLTLMTAVACLDWEQAHGQTGDRANMRTAFERRLNSYMAKFFNFTSDRSFGRVFGERFTWGE